MDFNIPKKYNVGGQTMNVKSVDNLDGKLGECCLAAGYIKIARQFRGTEQSESCKKNTFVHELTHSILDTMGESDLNDNEKFVCTFSSFLLEALLSMK